jgi:hypothetical protein
MSALSTAICDLVRVHDFFGPGDIDARWVEPLDPISRWVKADGTRSIFPHWEADLEKESSYNFGPTDRIIQSIIAVEAEVYFRLGRSLGRRPVHTPTSANMPRYAGMGSCITTGDGPRRSSFISSTLSLLLPAGCNGFNPGSKGLHIFRREFSNGIISQITAFIKEIPGIPDVSLRLLQG